MTSLLISEPPLQVLPRLAVVVGLNEAIVLQQLFYWMGKSTDPEHWVYNSIEDWREQFPFWSDSTIKRAWRSLQSKDLVETEQRKSSDRTKFYRVNLPGLKRLAESLGQGDLMDGSDWPVQGVKLTPSLITTETQQREQRAREVEEAEWSDWLGHFHEVTGRTSTKGSQEARRNFRGRRKDYSLDDLKLATVGCHSDEHLRSQGFDRPETILRDGKIGRYIELACAATNGKDPLEIIAARAA